MQYEVAVYDYWGRRVAVYDEVPLLDAVRSSPDGRDEVVGLLPKETPSLAPGYRVRVSVDGAFFCECVVDEVSPEWSDAQKLVLDRYVSFHEVLAFTAHTEYRNGNEYASWAYSNQEISGIVKDLVNRALGPIHYWVEHGAYPDGARREYAKFVARKTAANELAHGSIASGQWVGANRMDLSGAYAKDGDTISGVKVDGVAWPDLRLLMVDCEEMSRNSHAESRHPEVAFWTDAEYAASGYRRKAEAGKEFLQSLITSKGISHIELNPHLGPSGEYDDRVDVYGRYIVLVFGGGECFNAALVEQGLADVYLYKEGQYHDPAQELKDYYSYSGIHTDSVAYTGQTLYAFDTAQDLFDLLVALSYAAGGYVFSVDAALGVSFRSGARVDRTLFYDPLRIGVRLGREGTELVNYLFLSGNPNAGALEKRFGRGESLDVHGVMADGLEFFPVYVVADMMRLADGILDDLAYPALNGEVIFYRGDGRVAVGELLEFRGAPLRAFAPCLEEEWGGSFAGRLVGRVRAVRHRFSGKHVTTRAELTSPLRSVSSPIVFMARSQDVVENLSQFRLDAVLFALDMEYHLD